MTPGTSPRRKGGRVLLALFLGLLAAPLLLIGTGLAVAAGPDDVVMGKETPIEQGAAYSTPEAFAFDRLPVTVRVEGLGETYVGVGNPVDVLDVVEGTDAVEIAKTPLTRVNGTERSGEKVPDASQAPWWYEVESGSGTQELTATLEGKPVSFLAASRDGVPIKLSFGYRIEGLFLVALGVAGVGALLLVGALVALLTGRRERPEQWQPPRPPVAYAPPTLPGRPVMTGPVPAHQVRPVAPPRPPAGGLYRRLGAAVGVGVLTISLSGCSVPAAVEVGRPSKVSLPTDTVGDVMTDWNKRSNKAIKANRPGKWKAEAWDQAMGGPLLAMAQMVSTAAKAIELQERQPNFTASAGRVWSAQLSEYPMWAVVEVNGNGRKTNLSVYEQQDALSPWMNRSEVKVKQSDVPPEVEGAAPVTGADAKRVDDAAEKIDAYLEKPKKVGGLDGLKKLGAPRREMDEYVAAMGVDTVRTTSEPFDKSGPRMIQTPDGVLAMLEYTVDSTVGGQGDEWEWNPPFDRLRDQAGKNLSIRTAVMVAVMVPKDGDPAVIGVEYGEILGAKVKN